MRKVPQNYFSLECVPDAEVVECVCWMQKLRKKGSIMDFSLDFIRPFTSFLDASDSEDDGSVSALCACSTEMPHSGVIRGREAGPVPC